MNLNLKETTSDWFVCGCGNNPRSDGFETCTSRGEHVPPTPKEWDGVHYICIRCETVYNSDTLENVSIEPTTLPQAKSADNSFTVVEEVVIT